MILRLFANLVANFLKYLFLWKPALWVEEIYSVKRKQAFSIGYIISQKKSKSSLYSLNTLSCVTSERCPSPLLCAKAHTIKVATVASRWQRMGDLIGSTQFVTYSSNSTHLKILAYDTGCADMTWIRLNVIVTARSSRPSYCYRFRRLVRGKHAWRQKGWLRKKSRPIPVNG